LDRRYVHDHGGSGASVSRDWRQKVPGQLDAKTYASAARKAWLGLVGYIDSKGDVSEVCEGTNKLNDVNYYLNRARNTGDLHGQAPILWAASALLR